MDEQTHHYHPLGTKTLVMLTISRSFVLIVLWPLLIVGLVFFAYLPAEYISLASTIIFIYLAFLVVCSAVLLAAAWLEYQRYAITVGADDFTVERGLVRMEKIGIPYRRVKNIKIDRGLFDQIIGVSDVIVTVLGSEENEFSEEKTTIVLPWVSKDIAQAIQDTVLKKVEVEQVKVVAP